MNRWRSSMAAILAASIALVGACGGDAGPANSSASALGRPDARKLPPDTPIVWGGVPEYLGGIPARDLDELRFDSAGTDGPCETRTIDATPIPIVVYILDGMVIGWRGGRSRLGLTAGSSTLADARRAVGEIKESYGLSGIGEPEQVMNIDVSVAMPRSFALEFDTASPTESSVIIAFRGGNWLFMGDDPKCGRPPLK